MKALVYGGLDLWLMSLGVWAVGEIFGPETQLSEARGHAIAAEDRLDGLPGGQRSDAWPFRLKSFAQHERQTGPVLTLGPHRLHSLPLGDRGTTAELL